MLLPDLGEAVIKWKFGKVKGHIYLSEFRGSAPSLKASSLKASLRVSPSFCMWIHLSLAFDSRLRVHCYNGSEFSGFESMKEEDGCIQVSSIIVLSLNELNTLAKYSLSHHL